eukprot:1196420-Prorocentrum_minimum.AAC.6
MVRTGPPTQILRPYSPVQLRCTNWRSSLSTKAVDNGMFSTPQFRVWFYERSLICMQIKMPDAVD